MFLHALTHWKFEWERNRRFYLKALCTFPSLRDVTHVRKICSQELDNKSRERVCFAKRKKYTINWLKLWNLLQQDAIRPFVRTTLSEAVRVLFFTDHSLVWYIEMSNVLNFKKLKKKWEKSFLKFAKMWIEYGKQSFNFSTFFTPFLKCIIENKTEKRKYILKK